ncbi:hypothetical protein [Pseudomonas syringae]|uniref:hypothetical protein n=1 Tax=Pseudomonas syringae TaxID=317 RepID=UPI0007EE39A3|nr:hypothetical protein [Pseudomonas syringae]OBS34000.1 hypothetical protein A9K81_14910 [Pseudomonas syringae pv. syringae]
MRNIRLETIPHPWTRQHIRQALMSDFTAARKSIDQTEGGRLWRDIGELDDAIWVFSKSTTELLDEISIFGERTKDSEFWSNANDKNGDHFVREVKRKLYYSTSSLMTIVDIARSFNKKWPVEGIVERREMYFTTPGLHDFLQRLRNFSSHWRIAEASWQINSDFKAGVRTARFLVRKDDLLEWNDWGAKARKYIEDAEGSIDVLKIFSQYKKNVQDYYRWHKGALLDEYSKVLRPYFEYKRTYEGLQQALSWNLVLSHFKADSNPYEYLSKYLTDKQIELILSYEHRSEQQVNALIRILDMEEFCDEQLKSKVIEVLNVSSAGSKSSI